MSTAEQRAYREAHDQLWRERHVHEGTPVAPGDVIRLDGQRNSYRQPPLGDLLQIETVTRLSDLDRDVHAGPWSRYEDRRRPHDTPDRWLVVEGNLLTGEHKGFGARIVLPWTRLMPWTHAHDADHFPVCNDCGEPYPCVESVVASTAERVVDHELARAQVHVEFPHQCRRKIPGGSWHQQDGLIVAEREERCTRRFRTERGRDQHERHHDKRRPYVVGEETNDG